MKKSIINNKLAQFSPLVTQAANLLSTQHNSAQNHVALHSFLQPIRHVLSQGLSYGKISEWGCPIGLRGREIILSFLYSSIRNKDIEPYYSLWICGWSLENKQKTTQAAYIYPPAWQSRGVDLRYLRFAYCPQPIQDLKMVFYEKIFQLIILDNVTLRHEDYAFLAHRARENNLVIISIRPYFLNSQLGQVWATLRVNCWADEPKQCFYLQLIRAHKLYQKTKIPYELLT